MFKDPHLLYMLFCLDVSGDTYYTLYKYDDRVGGLSSGCLVSTMQPFKDTADRVMHVCEASMGSMMDPRLSGMTLMDQKNDITHSPVGSYDHLSVPYEYVYSIMFVLEKPPKQDE